MIIRVSIVWAICLVLWPTGTGVAQNFHVCDNLRGDSWLFLKDGNWSIQDGRPLKSYSTKAQIDFAPRDGGSFDIEQPNPRRQWTYADRREYVPNFTFENGTPPMRGTIVHIKEDKRGRDPILAIGVFNGTSFRIINSILSRDRGAPFSTDGAFWLVCTQRGKVKGDVGKGDNRHAKVYMRLISQTLVGNFCSAAWTDGPRFRVRLKTSESPRHDINCV